MTLEQKDILLDDFISACNVNYNVDDNGILRIYAGEQVIIAEICNCGNTPDHKLEEIVKTTIWNSIIFENYWNTKGVNINE